MSTLKQILFLLLNRIIHNQKLKLNFTLKNVLTNHDQEHHGICSTNQSGANEPKRNKNELHVIIPHNDGEQLQSMKQLLWESNKLPWEVMMPLSRFPAKQVDCLKLERPRCCRYSFSSRQSSTEEELCKDVVEFSPCLHHVISPKHFHTQHNNCDYFVTPNRGCFCKHSAAVCHCTHCLS